MYVVKVGDYYVRAIDYNSYDIILSKELMRGFSNDKAETIAKMLNGEVIKMDNQVTMCEEATNE